MMEMSGHLQDPTASPVELKHPVTIDLGWFETKFQLDAVDKGELSRSRTRIEPWYISLSFL
jgi:hypothetical protein